MMKKYATVPFICKARRALNSFSGSGFNTKTDYSFSYSRKKGLTPEKTYHFGGERFISFRDIAHMVFAALAAFFLSLLFFRTVFSYAVGVVSGKRVKRLLKK
ncbi:MAG: hypothetical protein II534_07830 [Clostridia bacterium]|nr:hypothetical protein [Clostridia bacterium]